MMERKYPGSSDKKPETPEKKQYAWEKQAAERPTSGQTYAKPKPSGMPSDAGRAKEEPGAKKLYPWQEKTKELTPEQTEEEEAKKKKAADELYRKQKKNREELVKKAMEEKKKLTQQAYEEQKRQTEKAYEEQQRLNQKFFEDQNKS